MPEIASRHHLELVNAVVDDALRARRRRRSTTSSSSPSPRARAWSARCSSASRRPRALAAARGLPLAPVDHLQGHVAANFLAPEPFEPPFLCLIASRRPHAARARRRPRAATSVLGRTLDDAAGEAFDKGARLLGLPLPGRPGASAPGRARATRRRSTSRPRARVAGPRLLLRRPQDRAALQGARPGRGGGARAARADLAASYQHAIVEALSLRVERALRADGPGARLAIGGGVAANGPLRERAARRSASRSQSRRPSCAPTTRR